MCASDASASLARTYRRWAEFTPKQVQRAPLPALRPLALPTHTHDDADDNDDHDDHDDHDDNAATRRRKKSALSTKKAQQADFLLSPSLKLSQSLTLATRAERAP